MKNIQPNQFTETRSRRIGAKFLLRKAFGDFCVLLNQYGIPFSLLGGHAVSLSPSDFEQLPSECRALLADRSTVKVFDATANGDRHVPNAEESRRSLRRIAEKWKNRADSLR